MLSAKIKAFADGKLNPAALIANHKEVFDARVTNEVRLLLTPRKHATRPVQTSVPTLVEQMAKAGCRFAAKIPVPEQNALIVKFEMQRNATVDEKQAEGRVPCVNVCLVHCQDGLDETYAFQSFWYDVSTP